MLVCVCFARAYEKFAKLTVKNMHNRVLEAKKNLAFNFSVFFFFFGVCERDKRKINVFD